jgi:glycosyltransferase
MKVSIITAVLNGRDSIEECIKSVLSQTYPEIEYIVIDGGSTDGTVDIIRKYEDRIASWSSGPDAGLYAALNKGISRASGDVIGFLHADDIYAFDGVIALVAERLTNEGVSSCYGDLVYVDRRDGRRTIRYWKSSSYSPGMFKRGWMPPHPTFFAKRAVYERYGPFDTRFSIAADYELMLRLLEKNGVSTLYIPQVLVKMRVGGTSNRGLRNILLKSREDYRAWKVNSLNGGLATILMKNLSKVPQFLMRGPRT